MQDLLEFFMTSRFPKFVRKLASLCLRFTFRAKQA